MTPPSTTSPQTAAPARYASPHVLRSTAAPDAAGAADLASTSSPRLISSAIRSADIHPRDVLNSCLGDAKTPTDADALISSTRDACGTA